jgi:uncharacterized protein (DUF433 family)
MSLLVTYPHIEKAPGEPARLTRLPRIRVAQIVMDTIAHGWSAEEICRQHPCLYPAEVHSALTYYYDNQEEIEEEIRAEWSEAREAVRAAPRSPFFVRMRAKGLI